MLTPERRSRVGLMGLCASIILLAANTTAALLIFAYYNDHPWWLKGCFWVILPSFLLTPLVLVGSLFGLGWKRWLSVLLTPITMLMIFWAMSGG